ncbi:MAG: sigma-70 family RNA polymerase sigma factor [Polyangiaceae bacterium]
MATPLADVFLEVRPSAQASSREELEVHLEELVAAADPSWIGSGGLSREELARALAEHPDATSPFTLEADAARDVALALACGRGVEAARVVFAKLVLDGARGAIAHMKLDAATTEDAAQRTLDRLLSPGEDGVPRVARYASRGALRGLVSVTANRVALELLRGEERRAAREQASNDVQPAALDPELALVKEEYRAAFKVAFRAAVEALDPHERNLLRLHLVDGLTLEELARMYGQHRATVVRHLARARERVLRATTTALKDRLKTDEHGVSELLGLVESRLDLSLSTWLR